MLLGSQALLIARYMDLLSVRQKLTATNIANADTPGYLARDIDFGEEMARALEQSPEGVAPPLIVRQVEGLPIKNDGNNVSLDRELRILGEAGIRYSLASLMLRNSIQSVRSAIREGQT